MKKQMTWVLAAVVVTLVGLSAWYLQSNPVSVTTTTTTTGTETITTATQTTTPATTATSTVKEFNVIAKQWEWQVTDSSGKTTLNQISVNKGDTVKLNLRSVDVTHGFSLPAFNINQQITPGQTFTVQFVADKAGTFDFACSVFCGAGHGNMRGNLIVS